MVDGEAKIMPGSEKDAFERGVMYERERQKENAIAPDATFEKWLSEAEARDYFGNLMTEHMWLKQLCQSVWFASRRSCADRAERIAESFDEAGNAERAHGARAVSKNLGGYE